MRGWLRILIAMGVALPAAPANAHHLWGAVYRADQTVTIEGELAQFVFRNPHSLVYLVVRDKQGRETRYAIEWAGAGQLEGKGVTSQTLRVGDHVIITGSPGRFPGDHRLRMVSLRRPKDNFNYDASRDP